MRASIVAVGCMFLIACGGARSGSRAKVTAVGAPVSSATTADPDGVRVLANGRAGHGDRGLLATTPRQLRALWDAVGLDGAPPAVDFATHVVIGTNFEDGVCQPEIVAAHVDRARTLTLEYAHDGGACILLAVRVARVVAVPRALVGNRFTWRISSDEAYAFDVPPGPGTATVRPPAPPRPIGKQRGTVELPAEGTIALRTLSDGRAIWVAHRAGGDITVVLADIATGQRHVRAPIAWDPKTGRFASGHDSRGRSVHGREPLTLVAFERRGEVLVIGESHVPSARDGHAIEARARAPELAGAAKPYEGAAPVALSALRDGQFGLVDTDVVTGLDRVPRLCKLPEGKLRQYLPGCPASAPRLLDVARGSSRGIDQRTGPFVVRKRGGDVDLVIGIGGGMAGWTVERALHPAAPRGATRIAGKLAMAPVTGDTTDARDGFTPPCLPAQAHGGPDEAWELTAPRAATYVFELTSNEDGALAIVDGDGQVLACNDDRHGHYKSSVARATLAKGATVRVIVDAFSGFRQRYTLRAVEETLPAGGVLTLDREVRGDTTGAVDEHSAGCHAPAGDHAYRFTVAHEGTYRFELDAAGWTGLLSVERDGQMRGCSVNRTNRFTLEPGVYTVVVDGNGPRAHGPYRLRVVRE